MARSKSPCIVFIDEIDAVGGRRDDIMNRTKMSLNQLLVEMDGFSPSDNVVVIAATNLADVLDPALVRPGRFDRKVMIELPDRKARKSILEHYLKKKGSADINTDVLARSTPGFSGADLENMVNWAAIEAAKRKMMNISMKLLEESLLNVAMGRERKSLVLTEETKQLCAYHEAGHALVALHTDGAHMIRKATLIPRGGALGMVNFLPKDDSPLITMKELMARMDTAMGGRVAEELIYGGNNVTQGASSDFEQATSIAKNMVMKLGMSPKIGPVKLDSDHMSPDMAHMVELEVQRILRESYARAQKILASNQDKLHTLAHGLLRYETLSLEEIERVLKGEELPDKDAEKLQEIEARKQLEDERVRARKAAKAKADELLEQARETLEKLPQGGAKPATTAISGSKPTASKSNDDETLAAAESAADAARGANADAAASKVSVATK
jgi:ATP-dependent metalloprotease